MHRDTYVPANNCDVIVLLITNQRVVFTTLKKSIFPKMQIVLVSSDYLEFQSNVILQTSVEGLYDVVTISGL